MNYAHAFHAERPLAQHCAELIARGPRPEDRATAIAAWRRDVAKALVQDLAALFSGTRLSAQLGEPQWLTGKAAFEQIGQVAVNSLLRCGAADRTALFSCDFQTAIALTDRSFGGDGTLPEEVPETLPRSASLLIDQMAKLVAGAIASAGEGDNDPADSDVIIRSESAGRLKPFAPDAACALFTIEIAGGGKQVWQGLLAIDADVLDRLLPGLADGSRPGTVQPRMRPAPALETIPLSLRAVLAELTLTLGQLERLRPGDEIPIPMPRDVPLRIGATTFAHGTIGTNHDRMAIQLTRTHSERSDA